MALLKVRPRRPAAPPTPAAPGGWGTAVPTAVPQDTGRGVRVTWWFTISSIVFYGTVISVTSGLFMLAGGQYGLQLLDIVIIVLVLSAAAALIRYSWFFRPGLGGGLPPRAYTLWLVVPATALYVLGTVQPHTLSIAALPLWLATNAIAIVVPRTLRVRVLLVGLAAVALHVMLGLLLGLTPAGAFWENAGVSTFVVYVLITPVLYVALRRGNLVVGHRRPAR